MDFPLNFLNPTKEKEKEIDAKFWKTVQNGNQTLFQCPFNGCQKSIFILISFYKAL